jgi:hypothetical protein
MDYDTSVSAIADCCSGRDIDRDSADFVLDDGWRKPAPPSFEALSTEITASFQCYQDTNRLGGFRPILDTE